MIWSSTSAPLAQQSRQRIAHMPMTKADRRDLRWAAYITVALVVIFGPLIAARFS